MNAFPNIIIVPPPKEPSKTEHIGDYTYYYQILPDGTEHCYSMVMDYDKLSMKDEV